MLQIQHLSPNKQVNVNSKIEIKIVETSMNLRNASAKKLRRMIPMRSDGIQLALKAEEERGGARKKGGFGEEIGRFEINGFRIIWCFYCLWFG